MKRASYQNGSVIRKPRSIGPDVWVFRYMEDGVHKSKILGTVQKLRTKSAARKEADKLLLQINERIAGVRVSGLCDRFEKEILEPKEEVRNDTAGTYKSFLKRVRAHWGDWRVDDMARDVMAVEDWINALKTIPTEDRLSARGEAIKARPARPLSKKSKLHVKAFVHLLFEHAMKWSLLNMQRNPIQLLKVKGKRHRSRPLILLTGDQFRALIADSELCQHVRVMIQVVMLLGLRASELLGLRWEDIDFKAGIITIRRSVVGKDTDDTKTLESEAELPMHEDLATVLTAWRDEQKAGVEDWTPETDPFNGWVFGNVLTGRPFWRGTLQQDHLIPAGERTGIANLGWHAFRHTYRAMLREIDIPLEMQQSLMRHADISTTLSYGGKTPPSESRKFNAQVVEMMRKRA